MPEAVVHQGQASQRWQSSPGFGRPQAPGGRQHGRYLARRQLGQLWRGSFYRDMASLSSRESGRHTAIRHGPLNVTGRGTTLSYSTAITRRPRHQLMFARVGVSPSPSHCVISCVSITYDSKVTAAKCDFINDRIPGPEQCMRLFYKSTCSNSCGCSLYPIVMEIDLLLDFIGLFLSG